MSAWVLVPCLMTLRDEYDQVSPSRDKGADGSIGNAAHSSSSDHTPDEDSIVLRARDSDSSNEVHALDIDSSGPWPAPGWFDQSVQRIVDRHRSGADDRLEYVIWNRRIASRAYGWVWRVYTGTADPHTNHAHFSARYTSAQEANTSPWGVWEGDTDVLVKKGDKGEEVKLWQNLLTDLGFPVGEVDGDYGAKTEAAVNAFRASHGAGPSSQITGWTGYALLRDLAAKYAGRPGKDGRDGRDGKDGAPGGLSGTVTVTSGKLTIAPAQP